MAIACRMVLPDEVMAECAGTLLGQYLLTPQIPSENAAAIPEGFLHHAG